MITSVGPGLLASQKWTDLDLHFFKIKYISRSSPKHRHCLFWEQFLNPPPQHTHTPLPPSFQILEQTYTSECVQFMHTGCQCGPRPHLKQSAMGTICQWRIQRGFRGFTQTPLPAPSFEISYRNEIIWSQWDQVISFSWDIQEKWDKISKAKPPPLLYTSHSFIHINPFSRNSGSTPT